MRVSQAIFPRRAARVDPMLALRGE